MATETKPDAPLLRRGLMLLVFFLGLCTIFAAVVTAYEAWQERVQAGWPPVTARVDECFLDSTSADQAVRYYIHCRVSYTIGDQRSVSSVRSINAPPPDAWQYPPNQIGPLEKWVEAHPSGTPIVVRYDPANHTRVALVETDMPRGGPRTPNNLKLLEAVAGTFLVLLAVTRMTRPSPGKAADGFNAL